MPWFRIYVKKMLGRIFKYVGFNTILSNLNAYPEEELELILGWGPDIAYGVQVGTFWYAAQLIHHMIYIYSIGTVNLLCQHNRLYA